MIALLEQPREKTKEPEKPLNTLEHSAPTDSANNCASIHQPTPLDKSEHCSGYAFKPIVDDDDNGDDEESSCSSADFATVEGLLNQGLMNIEECEHLLDLFRNMNKYFPFVVIEPRSTVQSMAQDRPFLLLAILATASSANKRLQTILDKEFRASLGQNVVLHGEKSLDILQGLLVYIAWSVTPLAALYRWRY